MSIKLASTDSNSSASKLLKRESSESSIISEPSSKENKLTEEEEGNSIQKSSTSNNSSLVELVNTQQPSRKISVIFEESVHGNVLMSLTCTKSLNNSSKNSLDDSNYKILAAVQSTSDVSASCIYDPSKMVTLIDGKFRRFPFKKQSIENRNLRHFLVFRISKQSNHYHNFPAEYVTHDITNSLNSKKAFIINLISKHTPDLINSKHHNSSTPKKHKELRSFFTFKIGPLDSLKSIEEFGLILKDTSPVSIIGITKDSLADECEKFQIGDEITDLDGKSMKFSLIETLSSIFSSSSGFISITIRRNSKPHFKSRILTPLGFKNESEKSSNSKNSDKKSNLNPIISSNLDPLHELNQMYTQPDENNLYGSENDSSEESSYKDSIVRRLMFETYYELYEYCKEFEHSKEVLFSKLPKEIIKPVNSFLIFLGTHPYNLASSFCKYVKLTATKDESFSSICIGCFLKDEVTRSYRKWIKYLENYWKALFKMFSLIDEKKFSDPILKEILMKYKIVDYMKMPIDQFKVFHRRIHSISIELSSSSATTCVNKRSHVIIDEMLNKMTEILKIFAQWDTDIDRFNRQADISDPIKDHTLNYSDIINPFFNESISEIKSHFVWGSINHAIRNDFERTFSKLILTDNACFKYQEQNELTKVFLVLTNYYLLITVKESSLKMAIVDLIPTKNIINIEMNSKYSFSVSFYAGTGESNCAFTFKSSKCADEWYHVLQNL